MAKTLKIITVPSEILRKKAHEISAKKILLPDTQKLIVDMAKTMHENNGVGLAAPQIGQSIRLVVVQNKNSTIALINPKITKKSWAKETAEEGCLSVPNVFGNMKRHKKITCNFLDINGKKNTIEAEGMLAREIQHEIDHLDGILFIDSAKNIHEFTPEK